LENYRLLQERQPEIGGALSCQRMLAFLSLTTVSDTNAPITPGTFSAWRDGRRSSSWSEEARSPNVNPGYLDHNNVKENKRQILGELHVGIPLVIVAASPSVNGIGHIRTLSRD